MAAFNTLMAPAPDDFWAQFNPANASGNSPLNGGGGFTGGMTGGILPADPNQQVRGPSMPQIRENPEFDRFYAEQQAAGLSFPEIMDRWSAANPRTPGVLSPVPSGGDTSMASFNQAWLTSPYPGTVEGLKQFVAANPQYNVTLGGSKGDKVYGPGGAFWGDAVIAAGLGGQGKSALSGDTGPSAGPMGGLMSGSLLTPFGEKWSMPSSAEFMAMPGVQAALDASNEATQRSAAARGTLLTGGTQRALQQNAVDAVSGLYLPFANLSLQGMGFNRDTHYSNQNNPFNKLFSTTQLGMNAATQPTVGPTLQQTQSSYQTPTVPTVGRARPRA